MTDALLGDLKSEFEIMDVGHDVTGIYVGLTEEEFHIQVLKGQTVGGGVLVHPLSQRLTAVHKIDTEVLQVRKQKEHVIFSGLWWTPFGIERLAPAFTQVDAEDKYLWDALRPDWGNPELLEHLQVIITNSAKKRGTSAVPAGAVGIRYLARSAVDSASQYLKDFNAGSIFVADMKDAIARWEDLMEPGDQELRQQLSEALKSRSTAFEVCAGLLFARRQSPPDDTPEKPTPEPQPPTGIQDSATPADPRAEIARIAAEFAEMATEEPEKETTAVDVLGTVFGEADEDADAGPFAAHLRTELQQLASKQQILELHKQNLKELASLKAGTGAVYSTAMKQYQSKKYDQAKEGFWECVKAGTRYLSAADPELASTYYNAGRALHLSGMAVHAKEVLKICVQLRTEQYRSRLSDRAALEKAQRALRLCLEDVDKEVVGPVAESLQAKVKA